MFCHGASIKSGSMGKLVSQDINVVALVKGEERYLFLFNDSQRSETLRTLGRYASDARLSFSWYDAAVLSQKVRNSNKTAKNSAETSINRISAPSVSDLYRGDE